MKPRVAIITPVHNGIEFTLKFLKSLGKVRYQNYEIYIIDDGSTDGTSEMITSMFQEVKLLSGDGNLWWAGSTNLGVEKALASGAEYILTVNNDVEVDPNFIEQLIEAASKNPKSLIGSMICNIKDHQSVWYMGGYFNREIGDLSHVEGSVEDFRQIRESEWLTGMACLIPVDVFRTIGSYDAKSFPQYYADADFSLRAKRAGYRLLVDPESKVYSYLSNSWLNNAMKRPSLGLIFRTFLTKRSNYSIFIRYRFYKKHFGKRWLSDLVRYYRFFVPGFIRKVVVGSFKKSVMGMS